MNNKKQNDIFSNPIEFHLVVVVVVVRVAFAYLYYSIGIVFVCLSIETIFHAKLKQTLYSLKKQQQQFWC